MLPAIGAEWADAKPLGASWPEFCRALEQGV